MSPNATSWFVYPRPNPRAALRLFCLPYAGAGAAAFRNWHEGLPSSVELCSVELPGRGARLREAPYDRLSPLIENLAGAIVPLIDKPFAFFGHSLGALAAFDLTRQIRKSCAKRPAYLFVSGRPGPHLPVHHPQLHAFPEPPLR